MWPVPQKTAIGWAFLKKYYRGFPWVLRRDDGVWGETRRADGALSLLRAHYQLVANPPVPCKLWARTRTPIRTKGRWLRDRCQYERTWQWQSNETVRCRPCPVCAHGINMPKSVFLLFLLLLLNRVKIATRYVDSLTKTIYKLKKYFKNIYFRLVVCTACKPACQRQRSEPGSNINQKWCRWNRISLVSVLRFRF